MEETDIFDAVKAKLNPEAFPTELRSRKRKIDAISVDKKSVKAELVDKKKPRKRSRQTAPPLVQEGVASVDEDGETWDLSKAVVKVLKESGFASFFPIQRLVIPELLKDENPGLADPSDVCISAPTGSGKTLSYVVPIVQVLSKSAGLRPLRALVIVPTRELAEQVYRVFSLFCEELGLRCAVTVGQSSFAQQQRGLVAGGDQKGVWSAFAEESPVEPSSSGVDILISTPGRLVEHLQDTPGFTLQHLKFLVIDEADRLMTQSYHDWIRKVHTAAHVVKPSTEDGFRLRTVRGNISAPFAHLIDGFSLLHDDEKTTVFGPRRPLRRVLCSATLTKDPQLLSALSLRHPLHFSTGKNKKRLGVPSTLQQYQLVSLEEEKPVSLVLLLRFLAMKSRDAGGFSCLLFTSSADGVHRLTRLLQLCAPLIFPQDGARELVQELSARVPQLRRSKLIQQLQEKKVAVLVCTDSVARGVDLEVDTVVQYDTPTSFVKTYIHRVGRTARAGRTGSSYTLVTPMLTKKFKQVLSKADVGKLRKFNLRREEVDALKPEIAKSMAKLPAVLQDEEQGRLKASEPVETRD